jgi:predicted metalloprotease
MLVGGGLGTLIIAAIVFFLGGDPSSILSGGVNNSAPTEQRQLTQNELQIREFVRMLSKENNQTWEKFLLKTECNTKNQKLYFSKM